MYFESQIFRHFDNLNQGRSKDFCMGEGKLDFATLPFVVPLLFIFNL